MNQNPESEDGLRLRNRRRPRCIVNVGKAEDVLSLLETNGSRGGLARKERVREAGIAPPEPKVPERATDKSMTRGSPRVYTRPKQQPASST